ncbi:MAG TPA: MFS transporter [Symbiobacteriaceae bacterium]|nr:MFS transporter [Symbiobacteriaceae bacterium]
MLERNARFSVINAALGSVAINLANAYVGIYAVKLGANNLQLGYLSSWPQMVSVISVLVIAGAVARAARKQRLITGIYLLGRLATLLLAAIPWFPEQFRVWALILSWVLVTFPTSASSNALQSFLADVFPGSERARMFAARNSWGTAAGTATILISGWLLDLVFPYPLGYQIMFVGSFLVSLVESYYFLKLKESEGEVKTERKPEPVRGLKPYLQAFSHKPFLTFVLVSIPFHFTWQMAWPMFTRFQVTDLGATNTWLSYIAVAQSLSMIVSYPYWARWAERYGNKRTLAWATMNLATAPILCAAVANMKFQVLINLWTGIGVAGVSLLVLNSLLEVSPPEGRTVFLAVHTALVSVSASIAPLAGAWLMDIMPTRLTLTLASLPRLITGLCFFLLVYWESRRQGKAAETENPTTPTAAM